ncbi:hypothetical protein ACFQPG_11710 [Sphingomonas sp. GCM10030256]|uniref:hypothetical protein n=1 Tax=Sphingomonas sp. GCM10030256 TaxID=3273427 RepID=UPI003619272C
MLVYGDQVERIDPAEALRRLGEQRDGVLGMVPGLARHTALSTLFVDGAMLLQGVADAAFAQGGCDDLRTVDRRLMGWLVELGRALIVSWDSEFAGLARLPGLPALGPLPGEVELRTPEGYAFYALYPEAYAAAARSLNLSAPPRVIGLRSIGTGLAAVVAAALDAPPPVTIRPHGDPFARTLAIAPRLAAALLDGSPHYVIVDEGPGLSGSSFGAVADWLEEHGVPRERIAFLPGHSNPLGPEAAAPHRARWSKAQRPAVPPDELLADRLQQWVVHQVGALSAPLQDISGGAWRSLRGTDETIWPAVNPLWERRKFLAHTGCGSWLVKFAGLGRIGARKLDLSTRLHRAGFGAEPAGLAHGWLIERWHDDARPARPNLDELASYLALRRSFPAPSVGATPHSLLVMAHRNAPEWLGDWSPDADRIAAAQRPVAIDGRMEAHEWLRRRSGQLLKADALDHHAGHELIGCQDIAWDVAGAIVELDLGSEDTELLSRRLGVSPDLLDFHQRCYLAFRIGARRLGAAMLGHWPAEAARNIADAERYERRLSALVNCIEHA